MKRITSATLKYLLFLASLALVFCVCLYFVKRSRGPSIYDLLPHDVSSIDIRCFDFNFDTFEDSRCTDPAVIESFFKLIHQGSPANKHLCASPIHFTLRMKSGKEVKFFALPGHDSDFYEIEQFDLKRVKRSDFIRVVQKMGIKQVPVLRDNIAD